jgi:hypothetical protein
MPDPQPTYREAVAQTREEVLGAGGLQAAVVAEMRRALAQMLVDLQAEVEAGTVTPERAAALRESIDRALQRYRNQAVLILEEGRREAIRQAVQGHRAGLVAIAEQTEVAAGTIAVGESFTDVPETVLEIGMQRRAIGGAATMQTLVTRNVQEAAADIDDAIESAIGRGVDNERLAKDIAATLAQGDSELQQIMRELGRGQGVQVDPGADPVTVDESDLKRAQRLEYDARRIAVSEINSHYHEADVISAIRSPVVDLVRWQTSELHTREKRYVPDVCDFLEQTDLFGYGEGLFHPAGVPALVHPHCQCRVETVLKAPEEYGTSNRALPDERELSETTVGDLLQGMEGERTVTDAYAQRQTEMLNEHFSAAFEAGRQIMQ